MPKKQRDEAPPDDKALLKELLKPSGTESPHAFTQRRMRELRNAPKSPDGAAPPRDGKDKP